MGDTEIYRHQSISRDSSVVSSTDVMVAIDLDDYLDDWEPQPENIAAKLKLYNVKRKMKSKFALVLAASLSILFGIIRGISSECTIGEPGCENALWELVASIFFGILLLIIRIMKYGWRC